MLESFNSVSIFLLLVSLQLFCYRSSGTSRTRAFFLYLDASWFLPILWPWGRLIFFLLKVPLRRNRSCITGPLKITDLNTTIALGARFVESFIYYHMPNWICLYRFRCFSHLVYLRHKIIFEVSFAKASVTINAIDDFRLAPTRFSSSVWKRFYFKSVYYRMIFARIVKLHQTLNITFKILPNLSSTLCTLSLNTVP